MTVLGRGDLSPRRRPRRRGRKVLVPLVVVTLAVGGWFGWQALRNDDSGRTATVRPCVQPSHPPAPAAPGDVHVRVLNATKRDGLAHQVALQLRGRGFRLAGVGNSPRLQATTSVQHSDVALAAAEAVAEQLPTAQLQAGTVKAVTLVIGRDFRHLASKQQAARARAVDTRRASPAPSPCPSAAT